MESCIVCWFCLPLICKYNYLLYYVRKTNKELNMKKILRFGIAAGLGILSFQASAQTEVKLPGKLTISGQIRPRFEFRNGFKRPIREGDEAAAFIEQRSRINAHYKQDKFNIKLSLQDVRIWGDVGQINKSDNLFSAHEAYGEWTPNKHVALKIGRQELVYDDHRILGNLGWAAQGRSHDAVKFVYKDSDTTWEIHGAVTYNQDSNVPEPAKIQTPTAGDFNGGNSNEGFAITQGIFSNPLSTQFVWFKTSLGKVGKITFLALNDIVQKSAAKGNTARLTVGTNPTLKFGKIKLAGSFYAQTGAIDTDADVSGILGSLTATYTGGKKVIPSIGFDYVSGDDTSSTDVNEAFNPLYGTHHKFYGYQDFFYVGSGHGNRGLIDIFAKSVFKFGKPGKLVAHAHAFLSASENFNALTFDGTEASLEESRFFGGELDLVYVKSLAKGVTLKLGTSFFLAADGINSVKGTPIVDGDFTDEFNNWSWAMIDFKF